MQRRQKRHDFVNSVHFGRTVGLGLAALSFASVLYQRETPAWQWLLLLAWCLAWPPLAYAISSRAVNSYRAVHRVVLFDTFLGSIWVPILAFNLVPSVVFNTFMAMSVLAAGGPRRLARAFTVMLLGVGASTLVFGFEFQPASSQLTIACSLPMLVLYGFVLGFTNYDLAKRLSAQGKDLAEEVEQRTAAQEAAQQAQRAAETADRTKSEFLSHVSHELRTPLNAIIGFSEAMAAGIGGTLSDRHTGYVKDIANAGQHLLVLINDILDLAKVEAGRAVLDEDQVDLADLVNRAFLFVRERADEGGIELDTQLPDELPRLIADPRRLLQILVNLLSNAVKFTPAGGRVTVAVAPAADGGLTISVSDTGAGMRPEEIPLALAPYRQVGEGRQSEGTGLGLPLVKAMTELHGGRLTMESTPDAGTTVTIWLSAERLLAPA